MPIPFLFIGIAAATGALGAGKTAKAAIDSSKAKKINSIANEDVRRETEKLEIQRERVSNSFEQLGKIKLNILSTDVTDFINTFEQIKNVDFENSIGLEELKNLHIDKSDFQELKKLGNFAIEVAGGATAGAIGGALTALGAYSAASAFATASTGTAIATLSGAAATNATLAFFGGGSLAAGGLGMAGGMMVLGGLVAGPALMVMGLIVGAKNEEKLDKALENKAQADEAVISLSTASLQCSAIRRRSYMFFELLARLDSYFLPQIWKMKEIIETEGDDYSKYKPESKKAIAMAASTACSIKSVLDTPILAQDGSLTIESEEAVNRMKELIYQ